MSRHMLSFGELRNYKSFSESLSSQLFKRIIKLTALKYTTSNMPQYASLHVFISATGPTSEIHNIYSSGPEKYISSSPVLENPFRRNL